MRDDLDWEPEEADVAMMDLVKDIVPVPPPPELVLCYTEEQEGYYRHAYAEEYAGYDRALDRWAKWMGINDVC